MAAQDRNYIYYGTSSSSLEIERPLAHIICVNRQAESRNGKRIPLCIWGRHGIGKTELIEDFSRQNGF